MISETTLTCRVHLFFCKTTDIFYATKENTVAQIKIKVEINELLHCFKIF